MQKYSDTLDMPLPTPESQKVKQGLSNYAGEDFPSFQTRIKEILLVQ